MAGDLTTESQPASESFEVGQGTSISFPPSLFQLFPNDTFTLLFTMFNSSVLLPYSETAKNRSIQVASSVIGATLMNHSVSNLTNETISITLRLDDPVRNCTPNVHGMMLILFCRTPKLWHVLFGTQKLEVLIRNITQVAQYH